MPPYRKTAVENSAAIHWLPGNSGMLNPSHSWIIGLYSSTGMESASETQKRCRNMFS